MSLQKETDKFRHWANTLSGHERMGEWECDYSVILQALMLVQLKPKLSPLHIIIVIFA